MARHDVDVIVVGAGPSGALAARALRREGLAVLVLDRSGFPRHKPCAGGLTIKSLNLIDYSVGPVIERATLSLLLGIRSAGRDRFELFKAADPICAFSVRERFDAFNFEQMVQAGAAFERAGRIEEIVEDANGVGVRFDGRVLRAKYLIGADGANSRVRRLAFPERPVRRGFAIEGLVPYATLGHEPMPEFLFGVVPNGYGWLFPKGDHVNVGLYTFDDAPALSKTLLRAYCRSRLGTDAIEQITGYPLGFGAHRDLGVSGRVLLVGDAAGFAEPLLGEGIHNAIKSGLAAAAAILAVEGTAGRTLAQAYRRAAAPILKDLERSDWLKDLFYPRLAGIGPALLRSPVAKSALLRGFAAGKTLHEITNRFFLAPFFRPAIPPGLADVLKDARSRAH